MAQKLMTPKGAKLLQSELENLRNVALPAVAQAIGTARSYGDLSENAEYHAAKDQQRSIEKRIRYLEEALRSASIIRREDFRGKTQILFGATVSIEDDDTQEKKVYQIVGSDEADPEKGLISVESLLAKNLLGKKEGDCIEHKTPQGVKFYRVNSVSYDLEASPPNP